MMTHTQVGFVLMAILLVFSLKVPCTTGLPYGRHKNVIKGCDQLSNALYRVYREVMMPVYDRDQVLAEIKMVAGINPEDHRQLRRFACELEGSRSVKELSRHFRLPYALSQQLYGELMEELSKCGGVEGCKVYMRMMNDMSGWVNNVNYSKWPLHATYAQTSKFLRKMVAEYGPDFLSSAGLLGHDSAGAHTPIVVTESNVDQLAQSLIEATSLADLARLTGYPEETLSGLDAGLQVLARAGSYVQSSNSALEDLIVATDSLGLLYLPEQ